MSFRKPCHMPFRKLIQPFTLTGQRCQLRMITSVKSRPFILESPWQLSISWNRENNNLLLFLERQQITIFLKSSISFETTGFLDLVQPFNARGFPLKNFLTVKVLLCPTIPRLSLSFKTIQSTVNYFRVHTILLTLVAVFAFQVTFLSDPFKRFPSKMCLSFS